MEALSKHANINPVITSTGMIFDYSLYNIINNIYNQTCTHANIIKRYIWSNHREIHIANYTHEMQYIGIYI